MTDPATIDLRIEEKIKLLELGRKELEPRAQRKATSIGEYDRKIAGVVMKLKNGVSFVFDGETIKDPPVTIIEKIAKGICFQEKINMELAEAQYKNVIEGIKAIEAELNGLQSMRKNIGE